MKIIITPILIALFAITGCSGNRPLTRTVVITGQALIQVEAGTKFLLRDFKAKGEGVTADTVSGVSMKMCSEMARNQALELICENDLRSLMTHRQDLVQLGACQDDDCLSALAASLQAGQVIVGEVSQLEDIIMLSARLISGESGQVELRASIEVQAGKFQDLMSAVTQLAQELNKRIST